MFDKDGPTFLELAKQALSSTRDGYDLLAPKFDKTPFRTPDFVIEKSLELIEAPVRSGLDLCCGTGAALAKLRPLCTDRLVGLDFSPKMIEEAKRNLDLLGPFGDRTAEAKNPQIEIVEKEVFSMDFENQFDVITCFGAFGHILPEAEPRFIDLIRKALVPGGRFIFVTAERPKAYLPQAIMARGFNAAMRARNAFWSPPFIMYYLTFLLPDIERLLLWKGFEVEKREGAFDKPFGKLVIVSARKR
jgi:SAM-dependent methyltransferase